MPGRLYVIIIFWLVVLKVMLITPELVPPLMLTLAVSEPTSVSKCLLLCWSQAP